MISNALNIIMKQMRLGYYTYQSPLHQVPGCRQPWFQSHLETNAIAHSHIRQYTNETMQMS